MRKVAVIGDRSSVLAFRALGVDVFSPIGEKHIRNTIDGLDRQGYGVIYITERYAVQVPEVLERFKTRPIPAVILIPDSQGTLGIGMQEIRDNVEKAVGVDIL